MLYVWGTQYLSIKSTKLWSPKKWWSQSMNLCEIHCTCDVYFCLFNASGFLSKLFSVNEFPGNGCALVSRLSLYIKFSEQFVPVEFMKLMSYEQWEITPVKMTASNKIL